MTWLDKDGCGHCRYCCMDMDMEPYCVQPKVAEKHPQGLLIDQALERYCHKELWEKREPNGLHD